MSHRETHDQYRGELHRNGRYRVIVCKDGIQWILQHNFSANGGLRGPAWRAIAYCTTRNALTRRWREETGRQSNELSKMVGKVYDLISTKAGIKGIHASLMARDVKDFNAKSLDLANNSTGIMLKMRDLSPDVVKQQVEELLEENGITFIPSALAGKVIGLFAKREANNQTHLFSELGWEKGRFAWGSKGQKWVWFKPSDFPPKQGKVWDGGNYAKMGDQVVKVEALIENKGNNDGYKGGPTTSFQRVEG